MNALSATESKPAVRPATADDIPQMCNLLNEIIRIGGTTALEKTLTDKDFARRFMNTDGFISLFVAIDDNGRICGFQSMKTHPKLPGQWADIATFARVEPKTRGAGTALFSRSRSFALQSGIVAINATIRADNTAGLAYYGKMGFVTYAVEEGRPLSDGTPVDRISKKLVLKQDAAEH